MLWRQGDIYVETVSSIPEGAIEKQDAVLADGELTGHQHRIKDLRFAIVFENRGQLFVDVLADCAEVVHEEHGTIHLSRGCYRVWRQREYDPMRRSAAAHRVGLNSWGCQMFQWLNLRANCSAADSCDRLRRGDVPRRMRVHGSVHLAGASWLTYLPNELEAQVVDVSDCVHLRGLPARLKCEVLNLQRTNVESLQTGLQVSHRIDATGCRQLQRVGSICLPELRLRDCVMLDSLAEGLRAKRLSVSGCVRLVELPASVAESVRELDLSGCCEYGIASE